MPVYWILFFEGGSHGDFKDRRKNKDTVFRRKYSIEKALPQERAFFHKCQRPTEMY